MRETTREDGTNLCRWLRISHRGMNRNNRSSRPRHSFDGSHADGLFMDCYGEFLGFWGNTHEVLRIRKTLIQIAFPRRFVVDDFVSKRIATLCEVVSYVDLSGVLPFTTDRILAENIGYVLLNVAGRTLELLAFCIVTEIWLRTAIDARPRYMHSETTTQNFWLHGLIYIFVFFTALLVLASASLSVVIFFRFPHAPNREFVLKLPLSKLQSLLEAICWGIHVLVVTIAIGMTSRCILVLVPSTEWKRRSYLMIKAVGPMIVSCFAYATRCGWLIVTYFQQNRRDGWPWWISFVWVPTATVSVVLLYSTRKRDSVVEDMPTTEDNDGANNVDGNGNEDLRQSLLRPQPPEGTTASYKMSIENMFDVSIQY